MFNLILFRNENKDDENSESENDDFDKMLQVRYSFNKYCG